MKSGLSKARGLMWHTLPQRGKSAEYFPQNRGAGVFCRGAGRHGSAAKKHAFCRKKNCADLAAFSLPQDSQAELMFGAARVGGALSVCHGFCFRP
ncbi:hypothetical protein [uncultured Bradyrhizobium sp.]|uniref:hypothetical protein n=1 Tax=uncultured Bradyrhizobium sp. TaxID=199684 RepID=UPI0035C99145